ncbi:hypothetical protein PCE1_003120 [Barthelona sp. PCE]
MEGTNETAMDVSGILAAHKSQQMELTEILHPEIATYESDLGNFTCFDGSDIIPAFFQEEHRELNMQNHARNLVQLLSNEMFNLPVSDRKTEQGKIVDLPYPVQNIPREKPVPVAPEKTRWEKFAESKGIKNKKSRTPFEYNPETGKHERRFGKQEVTPDDIAIAVKPGQTVDGFTLREEEKRTRVRNQKKREDANLRRMVKNAQPGTTGLVSHALRKTKQKGALAKQQMKKALKNAQFATASMGEFDREVKNEPRRIRKNKKNLGQEEEEKIQQRLLRKIDRESMGMDMKKATGIHMQQEQRKQQRINSKRGGKGNRGRK